MIKYDFFIYKYHTNLRQLLSIFVRYKTFLQLLIFFLLGSNLSAQTYTLPNEICIFSFETKSGKKLTLNKDKANKYLVYRFGSKTKIEFEYPQDKKNSFNNFKYSFFMRGGGEENDGIDFNYVYFSNKNIQYVIYNTYYAVGKKYSVGIKVIDLITKKITDIPGIYKTKKGTLIDFRENKLLEVTDEMFE